MKDVYLISCCRTPIGAYGGSLKDIPAVKLGAIVAQACLERANFNAENVDEVVFGNAIGAGLGQNVARQVAILSGIPKEIPSYSIGMVCGSGMKSVIESARAIIAGDVDVVLAGGTENMSAAPYAIPSGRFGAKMGNSNYIDTMINDGLTDAFYGYHMGITAENVAEISGITREEMDLFSLESQQKAAIAIANGRFKDEIIEVPITINKQMISFNTDEYPRKTNAETLKKLKPVFKKDNGCITAGNSSGINDGASALLLASGEAVEKYKLSPLARLLSWGQSGIDPSIMGLAPISASNKALARAGLNVENLDLIEANEAFASQAIAVCRGLNLDMKKTNVNGGAIALGHPLGSSGARIIVTLIHEMLKREDAKKGLATLCIGGGMGVATIWEKC